MVVGRLQPLTQPDHRLLPRLLRQPPLLVRGLFRLPVRGLLRLLVRALFRLLVLPALEQLDIGHGDIQGNEPGVFFDPLLRVLACLVVLLFPQGTPGGQEQRIAVFRLQFQRLKRLGHRFIRLAGGVEIDSVPQMGFVQFRIGCYHFFHVLVSFIVVGTPPFMPVDRRHETVRFELVRRKLNRPLERLQRRVEFVTRHLALSEQFQQFGVVG